MAAVRQSVFLLLVSALSVSAPAAEPQLRVNGDLEFSKIVLAGSKPFALALREAGRGYESRIRLLDASNGRDLRSIEVTAKTILAVVVSSEGRALLIQTDGPEGFVIADTRTGEQRPWRPAAPPEEIVAADEAGLFVHALPGGQHAVCTFAGVKLQDTERPAHRGEPTTGALDTPAAMAAIDAKRAPAPTTQPT